MEVVNRKYAVFFMQRKIITGDILRILRKEKGLTQEKLAEKAEINSKYLGVVENGYSSPTLVKFWEICDALGIKGSEFMKRVEEYQDDIY